MLSKTKGEKKSLLEQVEDLNKRITVQQNLIRITNQQTNLLTREIKDNRKKIIDLEKELNRLKDDYAQMILKSYKSKNDHSRLMFLFSSENFLQAYKRVKYMQQYTKHRKMQGEQIKTKKESLHSLNKNLTKQKENKETLIAENRTAKIKLDKERKKQEQLISRLKQEEGKYVSQIKKKQREARQIDKEINTLIKAAIAASNKKSGKTPAKGSSAKFTLTPEAKEISASFKNNKGKLIWPVEKGRVLNPYGTRPHPQFPNVKQIFNGVEIITESNAKVRAIFNGEVLQVQQLKNANKAVYIQHGNYITIYNNLSHVLVKKGDKITRKQELGTIFTHPKTKRTILKFFIYQNTTKMNPADWIYKM